MWDRMAWYLLTSADDEMDPNSQQCYLEACYSPTYTSSPSENGRTASAITTNGLNYGQVTGSTWGHIPAILTST